jgi:predicted ATPase
MRITHISLKNWRNFKEADFDIGDQLYIVGPNASGKSNLLDIFRFLHDISKGGGGLYSAVVENRGGISKIRCLSARKTSDIEISVHLNDDSTDTNWIYSISIGQEVRGYRRPIIKYESVIKNEEKIIERPTTRDKSDPERLWETYLEQNIQNSKFREIARTFQSIRYQHIVPQVVRYPQYFSQNKMPEDPYGQNFLELLAKTKERLTQSRLTKILRILKIAVPNFDDLYLNPDEIGHPHLEALYSNWRPGAGKQREDQFSDGTLRLIGLLWALLETKDNLLLLEEPELSLHPGLVKQLPSLMKRIKKDIKKDSKVKVQSQILISTHSYDLLSDKSISGDQVLMLLPSKEGTEVKTASSIKEIQSLLLAGMSVGDVVLPKVTPKDLTQKTLAEYL